MTGSPRQLFLLSTLLVVLTVGCVRTKPAVTTHAAEKIVAQTATFRDVADTAGLDYRWEVKDARPLNALQTIGNGCAFVDYNGDGNQDILLVGQPPALYQGDGTGRFTDVSEESGIGSLRGHFLGCAVGDYDNDGFLDLYLSAYRGGALLKNQSGKRFAVVTDAAGIAEQPWATSAAFFDYDGDGSLDLYIANYLQFGPDSRQLCDSHGIPTSCPPRMYQPEKGVLYRNLGSGRFADVTVSSGAAGVSGKALGVAVADYNGSGRPSLAIANDLMPGDLLQNSGKGRFLSVGPESGTAYDNDGNPHGGMGIDWGDFDNDGRLDLFVGTFQNEVKNLYQNQGEGTFTDRALPLGLHASLPYVTFGAKWLDVDNDGFLDLLITNGHIQDNIDKIDPSTSYRQPTQLFLSQAGQRFVEVSQSHLSPPARRPIVGRGLSVGDYDNDGKVDALVVDSEGAPILLHNETPQDKSGHWIGLILRQGGKNRFAYGAQVTVRAGGKRYLRQCQPAGSYLSSSDTRVHVGVGKAARIEQVLVQWPDGAREIWRDLPLNRYSTLTRGNASAR